MHTYILVFTTLPKSNSRVTLHIAMPGDGLLSVSWAKYPDPRFARKLGVIYCFNRPTKLVYLPFPPYSPENQESEAQNGGSSGQKGDAYDM